jgi:hypothetical protein
MATPKTPRKSAAKAKPDEMPTPDDQGDVTPSVTEPSGADPVTAKAEPVAAKAIEEPVTAPMPSTTPPKPSDPAAITPDAPEKTETEQSVDEAVTLEEPATKESVAFSHRTDPTEPAKPQDDAAAPVPPPPVIKHGPGFFPLMLGGVVAAGIGFGFAYYVFPGLSPLQTQLVQQANDLKSLRDQLQALPKQDDSTALLTEIDTLRDTAAAALQTAEEAKAAAAAVPAEQADVTPQLTALADRIAAVENRPTQSGGSVDPAVVTKLSAEIDTLRSGLADQKAAAEALVAEAETIRADAAAKAQTVLLKAALTKVEAAIQNGSPFSEPLALLANADVAVPETLSNTAETGVPTIAALTVAFDEPARAALEAGLRGNMGSTWTDRVGSFLRAQTGARSLTPQDGTDPDAILSRAGAAVAAGDLQTALTEIATLPETAQAALSAWVSQAKLHLDAQTATAALATALSER